MGPAKPFFTSVGRLPLWSMCAWESTTASIDEPGNGRLRFLRVGVFAAALVQSAIEQEAFAAGFDQVHGAGDGAGRAPECELHQRP